MGLLDDFLSRKYGIKHSHVVQNPLITTIGTDALQLFRRNPNRLLWLFVNMSANTIYLAFSPDVSTTKGIILTNGDFMIAELEKDAALTFNEVWIVADAAPSAIYSLEVLAA